MDGLCVLFALRREALYLRRAFPTAVPLRGAPCPASRHCQPGGSFLVLETGVGPEATQAALHWLFDQSGQSVRFVVSAGFAGALWAELKVGDVVTATRLVAPGRDTVACVSPAPPDGARWQQGPLLSMPRLISDPKEKQQLGATFGALAVDMESVTTAEFCRERGAPIACLRAISDGVEATLSYELVEVLAGGKVAPARLARAIIRRPKLVGELCRLARATRQAARSLAEALASLIMGRPPCA